MTIQEAFFSFKPEQPADSPIVNRLKRSPSEKSGLDEEALLSIVKAAYAEPSSANERKWSFYAAMTEEEKVLFRSFIRAKDRTWTDNAAALLLFSSHRQPAQEQSSAATLKDAGGAWARLARQARLMGISTRAAGGFDHFIARKLLQVPDSIVLHAVIALQKPDRPDTGRSGLSARLRCRQ
ncbi:hypothetical protein [Paenibacillus beijingensis]|uniref:hypothetical protein n=1 Tax=Paenibacillus beijingensis TaxID=1126833 RepID=UPI000695AE9D|nr:hypothetical protein [Paenibacillus beijingensis]